LPARAVADSKHAAVATVYELDALISWNLKHLANLRKMEKINGINLIEGYSKRLELITPMRKRGLTPFFLTPFFLFADLTASGGGLCEEAAVEALLVAIPHTKVGGDILFATNASPYADADVDKVIELLRSKGIRFNAMITGDCSMQESWNELP
jgi:hypothetical protein